MRFTFYGLGIALLLAVQAQAGTVTDGKWAPSNCGQEPAPVAIDTSNEKAFNKSLDLNDKWEDQFNKYSDCAVKEANGDAAAPPGTAQGIHDKWKAAIDKNEAAVTAGIDKFTKKK